MIRRRFAQSTVFVLALVCIAHELPAAAAEVPHAPEIIVERIQASFEQTTRVALFDNGVAVVTVRERGEQVFFRYTTLDAEDFNGFRIALEGDALLVLRATEGEWAGMGEKSSLLRIAVATGEIHELPYSLLSVSGLAQARLLAHLDELESVVRMTLEGEEELRSWKPKPGDIVELRAGGTALVFDVEENGLLVLEHQEVSIIEFVSVEARAATILRVVSAGP